MATRKSTGSEAGGDDPAAATGASLPTIEQMVAVAAAAAAAAIAQLQVLPSAQPAPLPAASSPAPLAAEAAVSGEAPSGSVVGDEDEDDEDDQRQDDDEEKLGVDDMRSNFDPAWDTEVETLIDTEVGRMYLVDALLAGVDATLTDTRDLEAHLDAHRLDTGDQRLVVCLARRLLHKTIDRFDSVSVGPAFEKAVQTAFAARDEGLIKFRAYSDTLETGRAHSEWEKHKAAAAGSPPPEPAV